MHCNKDKPKENEYEETCSNTIKCCEKHVQTESIENNDKDVQTESIEKDDKDVQTETKDKEHKGCVCENEMFANQLFVKDNKIICILNRVTMVDEEWEGIEEHVTECGMDKKEFMETMAKLLEAHIRVVEKLEQTQEYKIICKMCDKI